MRLLALAVVVSVVATPSLSFTPKTAAPGATLTVRSGLASGQRRVAIRSTSGQVTPLRRASRVDAVPLRFTVPNVRPGRYGFHLLRGARVVATARRQLTVVEAPPAVRPCDSAVYGEFGPGWERRTLWAGPLGLVGAVAADAPKPVPRAPGYFEPIKFVLVLANGETATVRVSDEDRDHVALLYARRGGLGQWGTARVADGLTAVRFEACGPSEVAYTQFNGGFVVAGPRCARLEVHVPGRMEPYDLRVPFGRPC